MTEPRRRRGRWIPGVLAAIGGAVLGFLLHALLPTVPWLTASLVFGVLAGCVPPFRPALDGVLRPGLAVASRRLLRLGIVVLGLKLSLADIAELGWVSIVAIVVLVALSFVITWLIARAFRLPGDEPVLLAAGFSICGVSAIGAMSAARQSRDEDSGAPTALVTLYGTLAIVVLPVLALPLGLSGARLGHWIGASVHDVGQVVATAGAAGAAALAVAVVVKLTRVLLLAPLVAITSLHTRHRLAGAGAGADAAAGASAGAGGAPIGSGAAHSGFVGGARPPIVPLFIVGFLALVLVRTWVPLPATVLGAADILQSALLATALAAIGAGLRLERIARSGVRSLAAGALSWAVILVLALGTVALAH